MPGVRTHKRLLNASVLLAAITLCGAHLEHALAAGSCDSLVGTLVSVQGSVAVDGDVAALGDKLCAGALITVGSDSRAAVRLLETKSVLRIDADSEFSVMPAAENSSFLKLIRGAIYLFTREPAQFRVDEPYINAMVEGTEFIVRSRSGLSEVIVIEGKVRVSNPNGEVLLADNERATASSGTAPSRRVIINPFDSVDWALHYPPIESDDAESPQIRRAASLLATGGVEAASIQLDLVLQETPGDPAALALKSIIALSQGEFESADFYADQALGANPDASVAHSAKSYVLQSEFDLQGALRSAKRAVKTSTAINRAFAWSRLAELQASTQNLEAAQQSALKALGIDSGISRTQSVFGYVSLARLELSAASVAFEKAIMLDQGDPLPRLGLGLIKIRRNRIAEGRSDIEIATSLDPNNALIRSYLGKSYFEEDRVGLATLQLDIAKQLDSRDPTPWFYSAILEQSRNRPVEALTELEESVARNDNRAVYRSRLALDEDLAARQARLGVIYNNLGFPQRALLQGWKSTISAPSNFSAHRLLADSYWTLPRHELARDSELLQSQMLQPLNLNSVRPRLSSDGHFVLSDTSQNNIGFNEFTRLFVSDNFRVLIDGQLGSDDTWTNDVIVSGLTDRFSYSLGQSHFETAGVRDNNDTNQDFYNVFLQFSPRYDASFQLEYRNNRKDEGEREIRFNPVDFRPTFRIKEKNSTIRLGGRFLFDSRQTLLGNYTRIGGDSAVSESIPGVGFIYDFEVDQSVDVAEFRYIYDGSSVDFDAGVSAIRGDSTDSGVLLDKDIFSKTDIEHTLAYAYTSLPIADRATVLLGVSHDDVAVRDAEFFKTNPKFGVLLDVTPATTIRLAAFSAVNRPFIARQTLEPTNVAGFNQLYDDVNGTRSNQLGIGIDHRFDERTSAGAAWARRELKVPNGIENPSLDDKERVTTAYLNHAASVSWAFSLQFLYEVIDRDTARVTPESFAETSILQVPLEARYFHPSGFNVRAKSSFIDQDGSFFSRLSNEFETAEDAFWLFDLAIGQRLFKRRGLLSLEVRNIFDTNFQYQSTGRVGLGQDTSQDTISRERQVFAKFAIVF